MLDEIGKYKEGETYNAVDYEGNPLGIRIKILSIKKTKCNKLEDEYRTNEIKNLKPNDSIEIIHFRASPTISKRAMYNVI